MGQGMTTQRELRVEEIVNLDLEGALEAVLEEMRLADDSDEEVWEEISCIDLDDPYPLESLMTSLEKTKLKKLALTSFATPGSVIHLLAGLPKTVVELDLSESTFDEGAV